MADSPSRLTTWCRLLRLPNLFTVPGDPLAGFMLATGGVLDWRVAGAMATSLLLYSAGLLLNDYFDRHVDARERPERPIPSGAITARKVLTVGLILLVAGIGVAFAVGHAGAGAVAVALALAVFAYDAGLKQVRWLGPFVMGSCRAGSVILGATFASHPMAPPVVVVSAITWAYITSVTIIAAGETRRARIGLAAFVPVMVMGVGIAVMLVTWTPDVPLMTFLIFVAYGPGFGVALRATVRVWRGEIALPPFIGALIRAIIPVQAAWAAWLCREPYTVPVALALCAIALLACAEFAAKQFYGS